MSLSGPQASCWTRSLEVLILSHSFHQLSSEWLRMLFVHVSTHFSSFTSLDLAPTQQNLCVWWTHTQEFQLRAPEIIQFWWDWWEDWWEPHGLPLLRLQLRWMAFLSIEGSWSLAPPTFCYFSLLIQKSFRKNIWAVIRTILRSKMFHLTRDDDWTFSYSSDTSSFWLAFS